MTLTLVKYVCAFANSQLHSGRGSDIEQGNANTAKLIASCLPLNGDKHAPPSMQVFAIDCI